MLTHPLSLDDCPSGRKCRESYRVSDERHRMCLRRLEDDAQYDCQANAEQAKTDSVSDCRTSGIRVTRRFRVAPPANAIASPTMMGSSRANSSRIAFAEPTRANAINLIVFITTNGLQRGFRGCPGSLGSTLSVGFLSGTVLTSNLFQAATRRSI